MRIVEHDERKPGDIAIHPRPGDQQDLLTDDALGIEDLKRVLRLGDGIAQVHSEMQHQANEQQREQPQRQGSGRFADTGLGVHAPAPYADRWLIPNVAAIILATPASLVMLTKVSIHACRGLNRAKAWMPTSVGMTGAQGATTVMAGSYNGASTAAIIFRRRLTTDRPGTNKHLFTQRLHRRRQIGRDQPG